MRAIARRGSGGWLPPPNLQPKFSELGRTVARRSFFFQAANRGTLRSAATVNCGGLPAAILWPGAPVLRLVQLSLFGDVDPTITFEFEPLAEELPPEQAAAATQQAINGVVSAYESGIIDRPTALKEIRNFAEAMGMASTITSTMIEEAEEGPPARRQRN
jgi:hypothetical protein